ncbi:MAG: hypothetical protein AUH16_09090 [Acidobacteria bacterium 13_2_20CM_57_7]|nr:MAG: hypothetical protein AUH16_09090 [Acidobacteria bacterium 13_2_20CM_57_7]
MGTLGQDVRYALRNLRKTPGFAAVAVITLALGIGASTAIFSVIDNILMEPFPYPDAQRFYSVFIHDTERSEPGGRPAFIGPELLDYMQQNHVFDRAIANDQTDVLYRSGEGTQRFDGNFVTPGTFEFLGMPALYGRVMQPAEYEPGAPPVFVLRYKTWVKSFGADPGIVNKTFVLNGVQRTLIGIMPPRFGWGNADLWIPAKPSRAPTGKVIAGAFQQHWWMLGHLKQGVTVKEAEADFTVIAKRLATIYPTEYPKHFTVQDDAFHCAGRGGVAATDRLRKCGEPSVGESDHAGKRVCDPLGSRSEPVETGAAAISREPASRDRWSSRGHFAGVGWAEVSGGADASGDYPSRVGNSAKHSGAGVHVGRSDADRAGVWAGSSAESGAKGH